MDLFNGRFPLVPRFILLEETVSFTSYVAHV